jgi:uncharacterized protein (DUF1501 family)
MHRRDFLQKTSVLLPTLFGRYDVQAMAQSIWTQPLLPIETDKVLVLVQLFGGNDGLNCVIPLDQYAALSRVRPNILIPENKVLKLNDKTGFHPAMSAMKTLFDEEKLAIVQSVGYPNPNFSHFRATDIWMSASEENENIYSGWLGRYLQGEYAGFPNNFPNTNMPDPLALQIGAQLSLTLNGAQSPMGISINSNGQFYDIAEDNDDFNVGGYAAEELKHVRLIASQTYKYGDSLKKAYNKGKNTVEYPLNNILADQFKIVARLIKGGLKTRVYMVSIGGFDTHADQVSSGDTTKGLHTTLLNGVSEAIYAFQKDLDKLELSQRVLGLTFSEFGRRIRSNGSLGTDHGAAAPLFLFGAAVNGRIFGNNPTIPIDATIGTNIPMQYDFRAIYASILKDWFCVTDRQKSDIMLRNFQHINLIKNPNCTTFSKDILTEGIDCQCFPNPCTDFIHISFYAQTGYTMVQVFNAEAQLIAVPFSQNIIAREQKITLNTEGYAVGVYYVRVQNGDRQKVVMVMKMR